MSLFILQFFKPGKADYPERFTYACDLAAREFPLFIASSKKFKQMPVGHIENQRILRPPQSGALVLVTDGWTFWSYVY